MSTERNEHRGSHTPDGCTIDATNSNLGPAVGTGAAENDDDAMRSPIILYEPRRRARTDFRIGLSAWTDTSLLDERTFYPRKTMTAEDRL
jgi:hypothetical protein